MTSNSATSEATFLKSDDFMFSVHSLRVYYDIFG